MTCTRTLTPTLGLAALAALTSFAAPHAARAQSYTAIDLGGGYETSYAEAATSGVQVGQGDGHALLWKGTAASVVDLTPHGFGTTFALGVSGNVQVGAGLRTPTTAHYHALLWKGTATSYVDLNPTGFSQSSAAGVNGGVEVGYGYGTTTHSKAHALLWKGTAASVVDLNPPGFSQSFAQGVSDSTQAGYGFPTGNSMEHALLWTGTADSVVDLNPVGFSNSVAEGVSGSTQVGTGFGSATGGYNHALLWHGTPESVVDLSPTGFTNTNAVAVSGNTQVGLGAPVNAGDHALVWHGTADSVVDLSVFLPVGFQSGSEALGVDSDGNVVGYAFGDSGVHAFLWHLNKNAVLAVTGLSPDTVDMSGTPFTLTVTGTLFVPSTVVRYNGQTLATTYVSPVQVTASVPDTLITNSGTADITVQTPHVATSGAVTFHIRPLLYALSPAIVKAGSGALTLTAGGHGYTPSSIVVFNGTNLATTYVSSTKLTAQVPASLLASAGRKSVMVTIPHVATSRGAAFVVSP